MSKAVKTSRVAKPAKGGGARPTYHHGDLPDALRRAVLELVAEGGPSNVSMAAASRRAGVSAAAPYRHFKSREELLTSVACDAYAQLFARQQQRMRETHDPAAQIAAIVREHFAFARAEPAAFDLLFNSNLRFTDPGFEEITAARNREMMRMVSELGAASDSLRLRLVRSIGAVVHGVVKMMSEAPMDDSIDDFGEQAVGSIELLIEGFQVARRREQAGAVN